MICLHWEEMSYLGDGVGNGLTLTEFLTGIRGRLAAATKGPWYAGYPNAGNVHKTPHEVWSGEKDLLCTTNDNLTYECDDQALIASAPTDLALAVEVIEVMRGALEEISSSICNPISITDAKLQLSDAETMCDEALAKINQLLGGK